MVIQKMSAAERKLANKSLKEKSEIIRSEDILNQFQIHQAERDEDDIDFAEKTVNYVSLERPLRLIVEPTLNVLKKCCPVQHNRRWNAEFYFKI